MKYNGLSLILWLFSTHLFLLTKFIEFENIVLELQNFTRQDTNSLCGVVEETRRITKEEILQSFFVIQAGLVSRMPTTHLSTVQAF